MLAFLGAFFLVALVNAQRPHKCGDLCHTGDTGPPFPALSSLLEKTPPAWNGRLMTFHPSKVPEFAKIAYDALEERLSIVKEDHAHKERKFHEFIFLHREHIMYEIEWSRESREKGKWKGKCVSKELREPFHKFEIPHNATFLGEGTIGTNAFPGLGVNVAAFKGEVGDDHYFMTVTEPIPEWPHYCILVHENIKSKKHGFMHKSFFDVELGYDPKRFLPPRECEEHH